jgi:hypothetical protein
MPFTTLDAEEKRKADEDRQKYPQMPPYKPIGQPGQQGQPGQPGGQLVPVPQPRVVNGITLLTPPGQQQFIGGHSNQGHPQQGQPGTAMVPHIQLPQYTTLNNVSQPLPTHASTGLGGFGPQHLQGQQPGPYDAQPNDQVIQRAQQNRNDRRSRMGMSPYQNQFTYSGPQTTVNPYQYQGQQ